MAISDDVPGLEVAITVDGNDLREYRDDDLDEEEGTTTRYIEAVSGHSFAIRFKVTPRFKFAGDCIAFPVDIDGNRVHGSRIINKADCRGRIFRTSKDGATVSEREMRRFEFASVETVSDGRMLKGESAQVKDLGTVSVAVEHRWKPTRKKRSFRGGPGIEEVGVVSEKALKGQAISHSIRLADPERVKPGSFYDTSYVPGYEEPIATFVFKYRSLENLKIERIIPRTPTPPPLEEKDFDDLTPAELRELHKRAKAARAEQESKIKIKREEQDEGPRRRKVARPSASSTQLELDEKGEFCEGSTPTVTGEPEIIEID